MASMLEACRANQGLPAKLMAGPRTGYDLSRVGAGEGRGFNGKKKLTASPWSGTWPAPGATLDLDFANNRGFVRGMGQGGVMDGVTFTRASNGNYINEQGLLVGGGTGNQTGKNLLTFSQNFSGSGWSRDNAVAVDNVQTAPDGTQTAATLTATEATGRHRTFTSGFSTVASTTYTQSWYVRAGSHSFVQLAVDNQTADFANFDLGTATIGTTGGAGSSATITDAGSGWYRLAMTYTASGAFNPGTLLLVSSAAAANFQSWAANGTESIFIWGAQLELGSTVTEYFPTNINVPRFDWAGTEVVTHRNLLANTDSFASFSLGGVTRTFPASGETAPTGISAALFTETASSGFHESSGGWSTPGVNRRFTYSVYAKYNGAHLLLMFGSGTSPEWANFDLQNGQIGATSSGSNANIEAIGSGWYRVSVSPVLPTSGTLWLQLQKSPTSARNTMYLGDGVSGVYVGGVQFEEGTTATDYQPNGAQIPTTTPLRPTATCNGLLIEEARTNRLLWCRDATQTQWAKTDITAAKDQTGIDGVANAASSLTATADGGTCIQTITLASGSRTGSVYLKRLVGSGTVQVSLDGSTWSTVDLSDTEWRRIVLSGTVTNPVVGVRIATSGDAVTMDFGQVEDWAFATSPILTTGASATRSSDEASISDVDSFWNYKCGTVLFSGTIRPLNTTGTVVIVGDGTYYRGLFITAGTSNVVGAELAPNWIAGFSGPVVRSLTGLINGQSQSIKIASSWNLNRMVSGLNGVRSSIGYAVGYSLQGPQTGVYKYSLLFGSSLSNHAHTKTISRLMFSVSETTENGVLVLSGSQI